MKKIKTVFAVLLIFLSVLALSGCGQKRVDIDTALTLKADGSGSRRMKLTVNKKDFDKVFAGTNRDALNEQILADCPSALEPYFGDDGDVYTYTFTLVFSSLKEYQKKAEKIAGEQVSIEMERPQSVFASGMYYREDFTSVDLLGWLGNSLEKEGKLKAGEVTSLFAENEVKVQYEKESYTPKPGAICVDTLIKTPVERIDLLTHYTQNKRCSRQVVFTFSQNSIDKNGEKIRAYLKKAAPDQTEPVWTEKNGEQICTISGNNLTSGQLNQFMQEVFDNSESFVSAQPQQRVGVFDSAAEWSELVDVRPFSYDEEKKIAVGYYIQWEDGMDVSIRRQNAEQTLELEESERYGGYQTVLEKDIQWESLVTQISTTYVIEEIQVDTEFKGADNLSRQIALIFQVKPDEEDMEQIRRRIARTADGFAEVTSGKKDEKPAVFVKQSGSMEEMNEGFRAVFGVQGQLAHETKGKLLEFKHAGTFAELLDFTHFIENVPLQTTLTYTLSLPFGEKIIEDSVSSTVELKQGSQKVDGRSYTASVKGAYLSLTLDSEVWNTDGIKLFMLILGFALIVIGVLVLADFLRKACCNVKKGIGSFNKAFGTGGEITEEFAEDDNGEFSDGGEAKTTLPAENGLSAESRHTAKTAGSSNLQKDRFLAIIKDRIQNTAIAEILRKPVSVEEKKNEQTDTGDEQTGGQIKQEAVKDAVKDT
ncbi:MAG: hypothetical protein Q4F21_15040, partial [Lachnospiraceae bacterium]|nr:hypothetical protein [Lachnospiraceae bacterium]